MWCRCVADHQPTPVLSYYLVTFVFETWWWWGFYILGLLLNWTFHKPMQSWFYPLRGLVWYRKAGPLNRRPMLCVGALCHCTIHAPTNTALDPCIVVSGVIWCQWWQQTCHLHNMNDEATFFKHFIFLFLVHGGGRECPHHHMVLPGQMEPVHWCCSGRCLSLQGEADPFWLMWIWGEGEWVLHLLYSLGKPLWVTKKVGHGNWC